MCIKNHTHWSLESVSERRTQPLHCRQSVNRSAGCRNPRHHTRLPRVSEDRGTPFRDGLKTCCSEISTDQHIKCNTNRTVWSPLVLRKLLSNTHPGSPLTLPRPPQKKTSTTYPKTSPHPISITSALTQVQIPWTVPIRKSSTLDPCKRSTPETTSELVLTPSRGRISNPLVTTREERPHHSPHRNVTYVIRDVLRTTKSHLETNKSTIPPPSSMWSSTLSMGQGYPLTGPRPGVNTPIYPSSLSLASGNLLSNIFPKSH